MSYVEALDHDKGYWLELNHRNQTSSFAQVPRIFLLKPNRSTAETV